jgi:hypothetical protein
MTTGESHQADDLSTAPYFHDYALQNAWVSLQHWDIQRFTNAHSSVCIPL